MIKNFLKIAWRNLNKNKFFSLLNILGLSVGLGIALLLLAFVKYEFSFDKHFPNEKQIYRVYLKTTAEYNEQKWLGIPNIIGPSIQEEVAGVKSTARLVRDGFGAKASLKSGDNVFMENRLYLSDSALFSIFSFEFIEGNPNTVFQDKKSIVISERRKNKLFGDKTAINQIIVINQRDSLRVTAVFKDLPVNSSLDCEMIYNIHDTWMGKNLSWNNASFETYCLLNDNVNPQITEDAITALIDKNIPKDEQYYTNFYLQPLSQSHLYSTGMREGNSSRNGNIKTIQILTTLSVLILLIASINYMNLATSRTSKNAKEVGVSKVLGAKRKQIVYRFYLETAIVTLIAIVIGYILAILSIPIFKSLTGSDFNLAQLVNWELIMLSVLLWIIITLIAGSFPAFYLSKMSSLVLMNKASLKSSVIERIRQGLVIFQFVTSTVLIISVVIIVKQMQFVASKDLGYKPEEVLSIPIRSIDSYEKLSSISNKINQLAGTLSISAAQSIPGEHESGKTTYRLTTDKSGLPTKTSITLGPITETLGLSLLAGKDLPENLSKSDSNCYILVNEQVVKFLGFKNPQDAVGQFAVTEMSPKAIITGVVKNFNYYSLKESIGGYTFYTMNKANESARNLLIRFNTGNSINYIAQIEQIFKQEVPDSAFDFTFVDSYVQNLYSSETRNGQVIMIFSVLTILIACLGLIGLVTFTTEQRRKEIGVRKVLGASVISITGLLSNSFLKLIFIAFILASPIAWIFMTSWLNDFTYRIEIPWWAFFLAALISFLITGLSVGYQTIKAAVANPVDSLRDE